MSCAWQWLQCDVNSRRQLAVLCFCALGDTALPNGGAAAEPFVVHSAAAPAAAPSAIRVTDLKTEHAIDPLGVDSPHPRFRWLLESQHRGQYQTAYRILVASSLEKLRTDIGDRWDSGRVRSDNSVEVSYRGRPLMSGERLYWKVRVWDRDGHASAYSSPAYFEMGLLRQDEWQGQWIAAAVGISSPLLRRTVTLDSPVVRARAYISGLGYYELSINGHKIGDRVLDPASTAYHLDPALGLESRVLYATYDVTAALHAGENALGVTLGHGWYSSETPTAEVVSRRVPYADRPVLKLQLNIELANGERLSVTSDSSWKASSGPITYNDLANGETYDARGEQPGWDEPGFDDSAWKPAQVASSPNGVLTAEMLPPERVVQTVPVIRIIGPKEPELFERAQVYDFGQLFSGWARLTVSGPRGAKVRLQYVSRLDPADDTPDERSNNSAAWEARQTDTYILKGEGTEVWEPRFTQHGFRYVEVRRSDDAVSVEQLEGRFVRSAVESTGSFTSSNELLNRIHHNIQWTLMTSLHGLPQDAAERAERFGEVGDVGCVTEDYLYNYDMAGFWEKWLEDIQDIQTQQGGIPLIAPPHSGASAAVLVWPWYQNAYPLLMWKLYEYDGDQSVLERHYPSMKKAVAFLSAAAKDDLMADEPAGDHMEPQEDGFSRSASHHTPHALTATAYYYSTVSLTARIARVLGHSDEAKAYATRAQRIKEAFNRRFFNPATNQYGSGSQTSNALPLSLGMVPPRNIPAVMKNLVDDIVVKHHDHLTTGIIGSNALAQVLPRYGAAEVMYRLANQTTYPSLGEQVLKGATAVCESYECGPWMSQNMKMFTSVDKFFYRGLAGIAPASPGYRRVLIKPRPVGDIQSVFATQKTVRGMVSVAWKRKDESFDLDVTVPAGMDADIAIPRFGFSNPWITESGTTVWKSRRYASGVSGLSGAQADAGAVIFSTGSGSYHFIVKERRGDGL